MNIPKLVIIDGERFAPYGGDYWTLDMSLQYVAFTNSDFERLSMSYLHAGYAVCVPVETMAHGYAVNWGDSLTLYRHYYARAEKLQWEQTLVDNVAILPRKSRGKRRDYPQKNKRLLLQAITHG